MVRETNTMTSDNGPAGDVRCKCPGELPWHQAGCPEYPSPTVDLYSDAEKVHAEWCSDGADCVRQDCGFWTQLSTMVDYHDMTQHQQPAAAPALQALRLVQSDRHVGHLSDYTQNAVAKSLSCAPSDEQPAARSEYGSVVRRLRVVGKAARHG